MAMPSDFSDEDYFYGQTLEHRCRTTTHTGTWDAYLGDYEEITAASHTLERIEPKPTNYSFIYEDYSKCLQKPGDDFLKSHMLYCGQNDELGWEFHLYPKGDKSHPTNEYISIHPVLVKNNFLMPVWVSYEISLLDYYCGQIAFKQPFTVHLKEKELQTFPTYSKLLKWLDDDYIVDDCLTVHYSVTVIYEDNLIPGCVTAQLFEGFEPFLREQKYSDVTLVSEDWVEMPAHKIILAGRSPVFAAIFENNLEVKKTNILKIEDFESEILDDFLQCLYNCKSKFLLQEKPLELSAVCKLLCAADKYQVFYLKERCARHLEMNLCVENVCEILQLADRQNVVGLKKSALNFINMNALTVVCTPGWIKVVKTLPSSLVAELYIAKIKIM